MPKKLPEGKWSWQYDCCVNCQKTETKHHAHGLCERCLQNARSKTDRVKQLKYEGVKRYQKANKIRYRRNWKKWNMKLSYKKFILSTAKNKSKKGIEILIDGQRVKTPILPPKNMATDTTPYKIEIFKQVYKRLHYK